MGEENIPGTIEREVAPGLIDIVTLIANLLHAAASQLPVHLQRRRREHLPPGEPFQSEGMISLTLGIGEHDKWPLVALLIVHQLCRFSEGHDRDGDATLLELAMLLPHLAEMRLAGQSSQVAEKNHQEIFVEMASQNRRFAVEIQQRQLCDIDVLHGEVRGQPRSLRGNFGFRFCELCVLCGPPSESESAWRCSNKNKRGAPT